MKKIVFTLIFTGLIAAGCSNSQPAPSGATTGTAVGTQPAADQKVGTTTKTGTITQTGERFFIQEPGKQPEEIESLSVDLSQYVGQSITVSGQFSGDTLFVGAVE